MTRLELEGTCLSVEQTQRWIVRLIAACDSQNIDLTEVFEEALLDASHFEGVFCLTALQLDRLLRAVLRLSGDEALLFRQVYGLGISDHDILGGVISVCRTVGEGLSLFERFGYLLHPAYQVRLERDGSKGMLSSVPCGIPFLANDLYEEMMLAGIMGFSLVNPPLTAMVHTVELAPHLYDKAAELIRIQGVGVKLGRQGFRIEGDVAALDLPMQLGNPYAAAAMTGLLELQEGMRRTVLRYGDVVEDRLIALFSANRGEESALTEMAKSLDMSPRSLQYLLREEGLSYNLIRGRVMMTLSERYSAAGESLDDLATRFGYGSRTAYLSAIRRLRGEGKSKTAPDSAVLED